MRAKAEYPTIHAAQHMPDGSDPMPKVAIYYDFLNSGDWLDVDATSFGGSGTHGIRLSTSGSNTFSDIVIESAHAMSLLSNSGVMTIQGTDSVQISVGGAGGPLTLDTNAGNIVLSMNDHPGTGATLEIDDGAVAVKLAVGAAVTIKNSSSAKVFEVRDDGTVHIKTGQTIIADL